MIRFVSMIDSKPVNPPYLNLIPLKNFAKKEQEMARVTNKDSSLSSNMALGAFSPSNDYGDPSKP